MRLIVLVLSPYALERLNFSVAIREDEIDFAASYFFERDARVLMFLRIHPDARACASLKLSASLRGDDNHSITGIQFGNLSHSHFLILDVSHKLDTLCHISIRAV